MKKQLFWMSCFRELARGQGDRLHRSAGPDHTSFVFLPEWIHCSLDADPILSDRTMGCYKYLSSCIVCSSRGWESNQLLKGVVMIYFIIFLKHPLGSLWSNFKSMSDRAQQRGGPQWDALEVIIQA